MNNDIGKSIRIIDLVEKLDAKNIIVICNNTSPPYIPPSYIFNSWDLAYLQEVTKHMMSKTNYEEEEILMKHL